jgi:alanine racemase
MNYRVQQIAEITGADWQQQHRSDAVIEHLVYDSRMIQTPDCSLFFALKGTRRDGHRFIHELYEKGVRNFIVTEKINSATYPEANFLQVENSLSALQQLAVFHRNRFNDSGEKKIPVIGITGSNGKTIVKEWLFQLLQNEYSIIRSPRSYNSQIGVPVSVWLLNASHDLAIFEAGISQPGEMEKLENMIQPDIGILTNIGEAHREGFLSAAQKFSEKTKLFKNCKTVIGRESDFSDFGKNYTVEFPGQKIVTWGIDSRSSLVIKSVEKSKEASIIHLQYKSKDFALKIPFTDDASAENAITCCCLMLHLGYATDVIAKRMQHLQPVNMRLELKKGINHCTIINDSYSNDVNSLAIALDHLQHKSAGTGRTVILSDFPETGSDDKSLYSLIAAALLRHRVKRFIGIGEKLRQNMGKFLDPVSMEQEYFVSTDEFLNSFLFSKLKEETILVKGARTFRFEKIVQALEQKAHHTVLEINLGAIVHNLKTFQAQLHPATKVMAMVKAFAYGSGGAEIAWALQYHHADYLGVAFTDEGVELRKSGISLPIMIMNPEAESFEMIVDHHLEPEMYSFEMLAAFDDFIKREGLQYYPVHIELETGMNRLGFDVHAMDKLADFISGTTSVKVQSVFSHLAVAEEPGQDDFTLQQAYLFTHACEQLEKKTGSGFLKHIANTAACIRFPQLQMDMVRLGIGLYGIDSAETGNADLQTVATLKSTISQIKKIKKGDSVSYGRKQKAEKNALIATVRIGYADGFPRRLGHGNGYMLVKGKKAPVIGTVCMDMTMIDITGIPGVSEGDEVLVFGRELPVQLLAKWADTISYEIMTGISQRVKRVYYEE